jgi:hypothetical protein
MPETTIQGRVLTRTAGSMGVFENGDWDSSKRVKRGLREMMRTSAALVRVRFFGRIPANIRQAA